MARPRKKLDVLGQAGLVLEMFAKEKSGWRKDRLNAVKLGLEAKMSNLEIAKVLGCHPDTLNNWYNKYRKGGVEELLAKDKGNGKPPALDEDQMEDFREAVGEKKFRTGPQAYAWLVERFGVVFHPHRIYVYLKKARGGTQGSASLPREGRPAGESGV